MEATRSLWCSMLRRWMGINGNDIRCVDGSWPWKLIVVGCWTLIIIQIVYYLEYHFKHVTSCRFCWVFFQIPEPPFTHTCQGAVQPGLPRVYHVLRWSKGWDSRLHGALAMAATVQHAHCPTGPIWGPITEETDPTFWSLDLTASGLSISDGGDTTCVGGVALRTVKCVRRTTSKTLRISILYEPAGSLTWRKWRTGFSWLKPGREQRKHAKCKK